jgi:large conductance mechanosensitive channel
MWKEFRQFVVKGNLVDLAVAFLMGVAFATLVGSFINDLIMPIIGKLVGNVDFANLYINLSRQNYASATAAREAGAAAIYYGAFVNTALNFLIIALIAFFLVKAVVHARKPVAVPLLTTKVCPYCKTSIPVEATRCPNCTSQLIAAEPTR